MIEKIVTESEAKSKTEVVLAAISLLKLMAHADSQDKRIALSQIEIKTEAKLVLEGDD